MIVRPYKGKEPRIGARVFVAETAAIIGDVEIGDDCSIWYSAVIRGDVHYIRIGARTNIQDNCVLHVDQGTAPTIIEAMATETKDVSVCVRVFICRSSSMRRRAP